MMFAPVRHGLSQSELMELNEALERRVAERTAALEAALAELREREQRSRMLGFLTNDVLWERDFRTNEVRWNSAAVERLVGEAVVAAADWTFAWWVERIHPEDRARVLTSLEAKLAAGESYIKHEYRFLRTDGSYADFESRNFVLYENGRPVRSFGAIVDLTGRRAAEARLRQVQNELIHVSRLNAMGTMASTLAHELNQPLAAVSNYLHAARSLVESGDAAQLSELIGEAEQSALRAGQIIRRLRELVARGRVERRPASVEALLNEACAIALVDAPALGVTHRIAIDPCAATIPADVVQIQQVLINLLRNALDALRDAPERTILVSALALDGAVEIAIEDSGPGVEPSLRDRVFSPFATTKADGMGIGLSVSRTIVEAHGGSIRLEDGALGGARFCVVLPAD